jgi:hypothetical protein
MYNPQQQQQAMMQMGGLSNNPLAAAQAMMPPPPKVTNAMANAAAQGLRPGTPGYNQYIMDVTKKVPLVQMGSGFKVPEGYRRDPANQDRVVPIPGGPKEEKYRAGKLKLEQVQQSVDNYESLLDKYGSEIWPGKPKEELASSYTDLLLEMKELYNLGVLNGPDLELMQKVITDPTSMSAQVFSSETLKAPLELVKKKIKSAIERNEINKSNYVSSSPNRNPNVPPPPPGFILQE